MPIFLIKVLSVYYDDIMFVGYHDKIYFESKQEAEKVAVELRSDSSNEGMAYVVVEFKNVKSN